MASSLGKVDPMSSVTSPQSPLIVVAGGSSAAGVASSAALLAAGFRVVTVGSNLERIQGAASKTPGAIAMSCDLASLTAVEELAGAIHNDHGAVDGLIHLVGGWRGGEDLAAQSDADWDFLETSVLTTLRNTTRVFVDDLQASANGRLAIVSSTAVTAPTPGNANYSSVKAAAENWVQAIASGFAAGGEEPQRAAAVVLVVKALVDEAMRAKSPQRKFPGFTDVSTLAAAATGLFESPAAEVNGQRIVL